MANFIASPYVGKPAGRNLNIELLRIVSALGIVWFHARAPGADVAYAGLFAFTIIATYFGGGANLARRLLVPWAFWTVFYLGWRQLADGSPVHAGIDPLSSILYGTQLWFLPFIYVAILATRSKWDRLPLLCGVIALALCLATPWWRELTLEFDAPVTQWLHALPAVFMGVAMRATIGRWLVAAGLLACLAYGVTGVSIPAALGGFAVLAALLIPSIRWDLRSLSACTMGVYLVHIAALGVFNRITGEATVLTALAAFAASLAGVWLARRYVPASKWVLG